MLQYKRVVTNFVLFGSTLQEDQNIQGQENPYWKR